MKKIILSLMLLAITGFGGFMYWAHIEDLEHDGFAWTYRSKYYGVKGDGCSLLDKTLGASSTDPTELLKVLGWSYDEKPMKNPFGLGFPDFFNVQHQALVRLLALQPTKFGIQPSLRQRYGGGRDHTGAKLISIEDGNYVVSGSASIRPDSFDDHPWEGYFAWEIFRFDRAGKFISREPSSE